MKQLDAQLFAPSSVAEPIRRDETIQTIDDKLFRRGDTPFIPKGGVPAIQEGRAYQQANWRALVNSIGQTGSTLVGDTVAGVGYLFDIHKLPKLWSGAEVEWGNAISKFGDSISEGGRQAMPVYTSQQNAQGFRPWNGEWWATNIPSIASTVSLMIPSYAAARGIGALGKLGKYTKFLNSKVSQGLTAAVLSRHMENMMEGVGVYEEAYQKALTSGFDEQEAKEAASEAAAFVYRSNSVLLLTDIPQYMMLAGAKGFSSRNAEKILSRTDKALDFGKVALSEGFEEAYQHVAGQEATVGLDEQFGKDPSTFNERMSEYLKSGELWTASFFGALGGGVFQAVSNVAANIREKAQSNINHSEAMGAIFEGAMSKAEQGDLAGASLDLRGGLISTTLQAARAGRIDHMRDFYDKLNDMSEEDLAEHLGRDKIPLFNTEVSPSEYVAYIKETIDQVEATIDRVESTHKDRSQEYKAKLVSIEVANYDRRKARDAYQTSVKKMKDESRYYAGASDQLRQALDIKTDIASSRRAQTAVEKDSPEYKDHQENIEKQTEALKTLKESMSKSDKDTLNASPVNEIAEIDGYVKHLSDQINQSRRQLAEYERNAKEADVTIQQETKEKKEKELNKFKDTVLTAKDEELESLMEQANTPEKVDALFKEVDRRSKKAQAKAKGKLDETNLPASIEERWKDPMLKARELGEINRELGKELTEADIINEAAFPNNDDHKEIVKYFKKVGAFAKDTDEKSEGPATESDPPSSGEYDRAHVAQEKPTVHGTGTHTKDIVTTTEPIYNAAGEVIGQRWIPVRDENGQLVSDVGPVEWGIDANIVDNPDEVMPGDTVTYEIDFDYVNGDFINANEEVSRDALIYVVDSKGRRIGTLPGLTNAEEGAFDEVYAERQALEKALEGKERKGVVTLATTKVSQKLPGRRNTVSDKLEHKDLSDPRNTTGSPYAPLVLGVVLEVNGKLELRFGEGIEEVLENEKHLSQLEDGEALPDFFVPGAVVQPIIDPSGNIHYEYLSVAKVGEAPKVATAVDEILASTDSPQRKAERLASHVGASITQIKEILKTDNAKEQLYKRVVQINKNKVSDTDYVNSLAEDGIIKSKLVEGRPFRGAMPINESIAPPTDVEKQETAKEPTPEVDTTPKAKSAEDMVMDAFMDDLMNEDLGNAYIDDNENTKKKEDPKFRLGTEEIPIWNEEQELAWFRERFPDVPIEVVESLNAINENGGIEAWGAFVDNAVKIARNAGVGTTYHEAFHVVFNLALTPEQRQKFLKEATEEQLADQFMDYVMSEEAIKPSLSKKIRDWFRNMYILIKRMLGFTPSINELFFAIQNKQKFEIKYNHSGVKFRIPEMDPRTQDARVKMISSHIMRAIDKRRKELKTRDATDKYVIKSFGNIESIIKIVSDGFKVKAKKAMEEGDQIKARKYAETSIHLHHNGQRGDLFGLVLMDLSRYGLKYNPFKTNTEAKDINGSENELALEDENEIGETWQYAENSISAYERLSQRVRRELASIPDGELVDGEYVYYTDDLGEIRYLTNVYADLIYNISDSYSEKDMMDKLTKMTETKAWVSKFIEKLNNNPELKAQVFSGIASKSHVRFIKMYEKDQIDNMTGQRQKVWKIAEPNRMGVRDEIVQRWKESQYSVGSEVGRVNEEDTNKFIPNEGRLDIVIEELDDIAEEINQAIKSKTDISENTIKRLTKATDDLGLFVGDDRIRALSNHKQKLHKFVGTSKTRGLRQVVKDLKSGKNLFDGAPSHTRQLQKLTNYIADAYTQDKQLAFRNHENNLQYSHINSNFATVQVSKIKSDPAAMRELYNSDPFYQNSPWFQQLVLGSSEELSGLQARGKMEFYIFDGYQERHKTSSYSDMSEAQAQHMQYHFFNNSGSKETAYYALPVLSDSSSLTFVRYQKFSVASALQQLYMVAMQEAQRNAEEAVDVKNFKKRQGSYHFFKGANGKDIFENFTVDEMLDPKNRQEVIDTIDNWIKNEIIPFEEAKAKELKVLNKLGKKEEREQFAYNYVLAQTQLITLFSGDPAFYKTDVDFFKRTKQVWSPGTMLDTEAVFVDRHGVKHSISPNYRTMYLADNTIESPQLDEIRTALSQTLSEPVVNAIISRYQSVEETDAQAYIDPVRYREIQIGLGRWTQEMENVYLKMINSTENLKGKGALEMFNVIKPFVFTHVKMGHKVIPVQNKNSELMLTPSMAKGNPKLEAILERFGYRFQENGTVTYNPQLRKVDQVQFESAVKVGLRSPGKFETVTQPMKHKDFEPGTRVQTPNGTVTVSADPNKAHEKINVLIEGSELKDGYVQEIPQENYRLQQETPSHHLDTDSNFGTQIRKLIVSDLNMEGTYTINGKEYTGAEAYMMYTKAINANLQRGYEKALKKFESKEKLIATVRQEMIERERSLELIKALDLIDGETRVPLFDPLLAEEMENMMSAIFTRAVNKQKLGGGTFVNASQFGLNEKLKIKFSEDKSRIEYIEAMLPPWSRKFVEMYADKNGVIDMSKVPEDIANGILYRIPTEDKYSMFNVKVVGFTDPAQGGIVVLPAEATTIAGLDFDIDKMFAMLPHFEEVDGKLQKVESSLETKEGTDNMIIEIMQGILSNSSSTVPFLDGGDFQVLKDIRDEIQALRSENEGTGVTLSTPAGWREIFRRNATGKALIGVFANHNANHAMTQQIGPMSEQHPGLGFEKPLTLDNKSALALFKKEAFNGERISKNLATALAAVVDNAKDPIASFLNINTYTADMLATLLRLGFPMKTSLLFLNQPIMVELSEYYFNNGGTKKAEQRFISDQWKKLFKEISKEDMKDIPWTFTVEDMQNEIKNQTTEGALQTLRVLGTLRARSSDLKTLVSAARVDTGNGGSTIAAKQVKVDYIDRALMSDSMIDVERLFQETMLGDFQRYAVDGRVGFEKKDRGPMDIIQTEGEIPWNRTHFRAVRDFFNEELEKGEFLTEQETRLMNYEFMNYIMSGFDFVNFSGEEAQRLRDELPEQVKKYRDKNPNSPYSPFLNILSISRPKEYNKLMIMLESRSGLDRYQKQLFTQSWEKMLNSSSEIDRKIAEDIVKYVYTISGFRFSQYSFVDLMPISYRQAITDSNGVFMNDYMKKEIAKDFEDTLPSEVRSQYVNFLDQFMRNNYKRLTKLAKTFESLAAAQKEAEKLLAAEKFPKTYMQITYGPAEGLYKFDFSSEKYEKLENLGVPGFATVYSMSEGAPVVELAEDKAHEQDFTAEAPPLDAYEGSPEADQDMSEPDVFMDDNFDPTNDNFDPSMEDKMINDVLVNYDPFNMTPEEHALMAAHWEKAHQEFLDQLDNVDGVEDTDC